MARRRERRSISGGGGESHTALIRAAAKKIIDSEDALMGISLTFEERAVELDIKIDTELGRVGYSRASFSFRPDIVARFNLKRDPRILDQKWTGIHDSGAWIVEAETDPRKIFKEVIKIEGYKRLTADRDIGRYSYALILACWEGAIFPDPENIEPFDALWLF